MRACASSSNTDLLKWLQTLLKFTYNNELISPLPLSSPVSLDLSCATTPACRAATDHNSDNTTAILREWLTAMQSYYHYVEWRPMELPT